MTTKHAMVVVIIPHALLARIEKKRGDVSRSKFLLRIIEREFV